MNYTADITRTIFAQRLETAKHGQWILYHLGFLYEDRIYNRQLNSVATAAYNSYAQGRTCLVQRRLGDKQYEYYAVVR